MSFPSRSGLLPGLLLVLILLRAVLPSLGAQPSSPAPQAGGMQAGAPEPAAAAVAAAAPASGERTLTTALEVLSLSAQRAGSRIPVRITGVVTAAEPSWRGQFFVQDSSSGVFVENLSPHQPAVGDLVELSGVSHPGAFAPIIGSPVWKKIGTAPLPAPKAVSIDSLEAGLEDSQRIQISGIVRRVSWENRMLVADLAVSRYRLLVYTQSPPLGSPQSLVGARVTVRGTAATDYNMTLRHLTSVAVYVPRPEDFIVEEIEKASPFDEPPVRLTDVAQYRRSSDPAKRIHVSGTLILQRPGEDLFVQDGTGGLRIRSSDTLRLQPGEAVEAVGFLEFEGHLPLLQDAVVRRGTGAARPPAVRGTRMTEVLKGLHHADLVTLRGRLLDRSHRSFRRDVGDMRGERSTWLIQGEGLSFTMEHESEAPDPLLEAIPVGSLIEASGACFSEAGRDGKLKSLTLLVAGPASVRVLEYPSWFTPARMLGILIVVVLVLSIVAAWSITVSRKNSALRVLMHEREQARQELQQAHDTLEQKVRERTDQLKVEISARKASELQFKAVLAERTRLARDLHDSLEQTLTGISLQLDTSAKLFAQSPENAHHHLQLARNWIRQSQVELHRSIWDLRSRELERFDLANALRQSARHVFEGTEIRMEMETVGKDRPLPEVVEENVLRIAQEALTNVIKHAKATQVWICLEFTPTQLTLRVRDNGVGGIRLEVPSPGDNHFGLLGMSERAKRLTGRFHIDSVEGRGTQILVEVPLEPAAEPPPPSPELHS